MEATMHSLAMAQNILQSALAEAANYKRKCIEAICVKVADRDFREAASLGFSLDHAEVI